MTDERDAMIERALAEMELDGTFTMNNPLAFKDAEWMADFTLARIKEALDAYEAKVKEALEKAEWSYRRGPDRESVDSISAPRIIAAVRRHLKEG